MDLLQRFTFQLKIPPLRELREDILPLAEFLLQELARTGKARSPTTQAKAALVAHDWPGNIRGLRNALEWACAFAPKGTTIALEHLPPNVFETSSAPASTAPGPFRRDVAALEKALIADVLKRADGVLARARLVARR